MQAGDGLAGEGLVHSFDVNVSWRVGAEHAFDLHRLSLALAVDTLEQDGLHQRLLHAGLGAHHENRWVVHAWHQTAAGHLRGALASTPKTGHDGARLLAPVLVLIVRRQVLRAGRLELTVRSVTSRSPGIGFLPDVVQLVVQRRLFAQVVVLVVLFVLIVATHLSLLNEEVAPPLGGRGLLSPALLVFLLLILLLVFLLILLTFPLRLLFFDGGSSCVVVLLLRLVVVVVLFGVLRLSIRVVSTRIVITVTATVEIFRANSLAHRARHHLCSLIIGTDV
mmetsp:Transcript_2719/g.4943  ORF Transcript_2719/g.4943 Transcript_2719/m.4943 type:complete len:279 (-) Transcript_2719:79-915(-)